MKKLVLILSALYLIRNYFYRQANEWFWRGDFKIYYNFADHGDRNGWFYKDWTSIIWKPFTWISLDIAFIVWYVILVVCVLILVWKLLEIPYGWIFVFPCIKIAGWSLGVGNIMPILAALCLTPLGCLAAGLVKPYLLGFMVVHAFVRFRSHATSDEVYIPRRGCDLSVLTAHSAFDKERI